MNRFLTICLISLLLSACGEKEYLVTFTTPYGDMHAILYDETPQHKENFIKLAREGFYDSLLFHRVINDFMIQGGDPESRGAAPGIPLGSGGPGYTVPAEFNKNLYHTKGALSAARQGDQVNPQKASSGSQFYIVDGQTYTEKDLTTDMAKLGLTAQQLMETNDSLRQELIAVYQTQGPEAYRQKLLDMKEYLAEESGQPVSVFSQTIDPERLEAYTTVGGAPHLDDEYTVFGQVIDGLDIIDKIAETPVDGRDRPMRDVPFKVSVEEVSKSRIEKEYGYTFPEEK